MGVTFRKLKLFLLDGIDKELLGYSTVFSTSVFLSLPHSRNLNRCLPVVSVQQISILETSLFSDSAEEINESRVTTSGVTSCDMLFHTILFLPFLFLGHRVNFLVS
jgi:hypothetical protein